MLIQYKNHKYSPESNFDGNFFNTIVDNESDKITIQRISKNRFLIITDAGNIEAFAAKDQKHIYVMIDGYQYIFDVKPDDIIFQGGDFTNDDKHDNISSPMPGSIVKVLINEGDFIEAGTPVIIIEAMKMETKLYSSISGIVKKVNCKIGEQVDSDLILVEIVKDY